MNFRLVREKVMVEVAVYDALREMVNSEIEEEKPLLTLKSNKDAKTYANGKNKNFRMTEYCINWYVALKFNAWSVRTDKAKTYYWFHENGEYILQLWLKDTFGTISNAINNSNTFDDLFNNYLDWFNRKRLEMRKKMENQLKETTNNKLAEMKIPHSHGGVANLLKVLTNTMKMQGADIRSIAKVQYAICKQAGIYIPDEFIEDVAVAMECENPDVLDN